MPDDARLDALQGIEVLTHAITIRSIPRLIEPFLATDLTIQQIKVLGAIVTADDGVSGTELAARFAVSMATMSKLVDRIVAQGLAERAIDERDQRIRRVRPTVRGRAVIGQLLGGRPELGDDVLNRLTLDELRSLERGMRAIYRELLHLSAERPARD